MPRLDLFGSAARGVDFTAASDIDPLTEYEPGRSPSWAPLSDLRGARAALFGRDVDVVTADAVQDPHLRASIAPSREPLVGA